MPWSTIQDIVTPAKCDVLLIPCCCYSGLAFIQRQNIYAKEVIVFSGWNEVLYGHQMLPRVCSGMERWINDPHVEERTAGTLNTYISSAVRHTRATKAQEYYTKVDDVYAELRGSANGDISVLEDGMVMLGVGSQQRRVWESEELKKAIAKYLRKMEELGELEGMEKYCYTQPVHVQEDIDWEAGFKLDSSGKLKRYWRIPRRQG